MKGGRDGNSQVSAQPQVFVEDWDAGYGSPYLISGEEPAVDVGLVEDGDELLVHDGDPAGMRGPVAFVDGVRRGEATLYLTVHDVLARGVAGAHARGAVLVDPGERPRYDHCAVERQVIWGSGQRAALPAVAGGWAWTAHSVAADHPDAPMFELQRRMREAEGRLAEDLCEAGYLTVVDGPLNYVRSRDLPVIGLVKTHHQRLLPQELHSRVPSIGAGQRTSLFRLRAELYACYLRLAPRPGNSGPWAGIVRLELPATAGLADARRAADCAAGALPAFAGVPHVDPRAPQNLQPTGALERHLRHLLGDGGLANRAVRAAVDLLVSGAPV